MPTTSFKPSIRLYESEWEAADDVAEIVGTTPTRN